MAEPSQVPAFARLLLAQSDEDRTAVLAAEHADFAANKDNWTVLIDAFEGTGGFADGSYLWRFRNEIADDFTDRQAMARYHNYVETIIDLYVRHVFTQEPKRQAKSDELKAFWDDVDGEGTTISDFLRKSVSLALAAGHTGILMDATPDQPTGPAVADQKARPFLVNYLATAIPDWRMRRDAVTAVKLLEAPPDASIVEPPESDPDLAKRYLLWDDEGWARFNGKGELIDANLPKLDMVPFAVLRPKPSILRPFVGRSLFSSGKLVQALFNRMSEEDEVLRNQAFSQFVVEVPENGNVEAAKKQVGEDMGTKRGMAVQGSAKFISPDMKIPNEVRQNILQIIRELYRVAHMRYERDTLDAESAESIRLQYAELNEMLQGLAASLQSVEILITRFFFAWTTPTSDAAQAAFEAAEVSVEYPDEFFLDNLGRDLQDWALAIAMDLGDTMTKRIKKRAAQRVDPDAPVDVMDEVFKEIDAQPTQQQLAQQMAQAGAASASDALRAGAQKRLGQFFTPNPDVAAQ